MKKRIIVLMMVTSVTLGMSGCGNQKTQTGENGDGTTCVDAEVLQKSEDATKESDANGNEFLTPDEDAVNEDDFAYEEDGTYEDDFAYEEDGTYEDDLSYEEDTTGEDEDITFEDESYCAVIVPNPSWEYYVLNEQTEKSSDISLELISEETNQIIDVDEWLWENDLEMPGFPYSDDAYDYEAWGENVYDAYLLKVTNQETGEQMEYDFTEFRYADYYVPEDYDYICQRVIYAKVKDQILYVATGHNTYAASCPQNAYITAIDMTTNQVIWKTEPLTCNSYSFALVDRYIICGYGFTDEEDNLKIVSIEDGTIVGEVPVKTMPEYIIWKDGRLYVRTYNTNYIYEVKGATM